MDSTDVPDADGEPRRLRLREVRTELRWLLISTWGRGSPGLVWRHSAESTLRVKILKVLACFVLGLPLVCGVARRRLWRRINPHLEELAFGSASCVFHEPNSPGMIFKLDLLSSFHNRAGQRLWLRQVESTYETMRNYLGPHLEPTRFEQRDVGYPRPCWVTGGVQRFVTGEVFHFEKLKNPAWPPGEPHLRRQWREMCVAAQVMERETGYLPDLVGIRNVLIERPPGAPSRLVIIDTLPIPTAKSLSGTPELEVILNARRVIAEGAHLVV